MDLPTYTNIWRIEKRLYKLYDFRLPMPLPISWIAVFCGITIPYVAILVAIGLPFNHNLLWLYVLPPGVLTWLTTRPVLENKRLPELLVSQLRYIGEPRTWCRLAPLSEKNEIRVYARVWHRAPAYAEEAEVLTAPAATAPALRGRDLPAAPEPRPGTGRGPGSARRIWQARPGRPDQLPQSAQAARAGGRTPGSLPYPPPGTRQAREARVGYPCRSGRAPNGPPWDARLPPRVTGPDGPRQAGLAQRAHQARRARRARRGPRPCGRVRRDLPGTEARHPGPGAEGPRSGRPRGNWSRSGRTCCGSSCCG